MLFGFHVARPPLDWATLPTALTDWCHSAGGVSAFALLLVTLAAVVRSEQSGRKRRDAGPVILLLSLLFPPAALLLWLHLTLKRRWLDHEKGLQLPLLILGSAVTIGFYEVYGVQRLFSAVLGKTPRPWVETLLTWGGGCAVVFFVLPMLTAVVRLNFRRIWALARLSFKEALRSRVVMVFSLMALVFLFADFFVGFKEENQVRNYVKVTYWSMVPLFMLTATILGAFSLPTDIKNQSIHTIVTKPVEKLEIVLGRFLGFGMLLMLGLLAVAGVSYLYILRGVTQEAAAESFKARMPVYGDIYFFKNNKKDTAGDSSPRPFDYRTYIWGPHPADPTPGKHYAIWDFDNLPSLLDTQDWVTFEYRFDIYKLQKGEEGQNITCTFSFIDGRQSIPFAEKNLKALYQKRTRLTNEHIQKTRKPLTEDDKEAIDKQLIGEFGCYHLEGQKVETDHTQTILIPGELIKKLRQKDRDEPRTVRAANQKFEAPFLKVLVNVEDNPTSKSQMVGVSKDDFYILAAEKPFWQNFFKGIVAMGMSILLVLGIAVACSTYLSGVVSWLATLWFLLNGLSRESIMEVAEGKAFGGGPIQAMQNLAENRPLGAGAIDPESVSRIVLRLDEFYQWLLRLVLNVFPDVGRFDLIDWVANGFDIPWTSVLFFDNFVYLAGYLLPWLVLSYYLLKFREIANPT